MLLGKCLNCCKEFGYYRTNKSGKYCSLNCFFSYPENIKRNSERRRGRKISEETKKKMSLARKGIKQNKTWIKRRFKSFKKNMLLRVKKTPEILNLKTSKKYKETRKKVLERDNYTCQECGDKSGGNLQVHHIIPLSFIFDEYKIIKNDNLLFNIDNQITLCKNCHKKTPSYGSKLSIEAKMLKELKTTWEKEGKKGDFETYYKGKMEKLIDFIKGKLD